MKHKELLELLQEPDRDIPEYFKTAEQWGREWNVSAGHASKLLRMARDHVVVKKFRIKVGNRGIYHAPHYAFKSEIPQHRACARRGSRRGSQAPRGRR